MVCVIKSESLVMVVSSRNNHKIMGCEGLQDMYCVTESAVLMIVSQLAEQKPTATLVVVSLQSTVCAIRTGFLIMAVSSQTEHKHHGLL